MILQNTGGRIPNGITGRDAHRIPEWLKALLSSTHLLLCFSLSHPTQLSPCLILVYLPYLPSFSSCPTFISAHPWPFIPPFLYFPANVLGSEHIKETEREAGRETLNDSWVSALAWCRGLKNLASWCWIALDTHSLFLLSFSVSLSLSVHIELLPGSVKGTGRQRSPTSKPSPLAVFSHTIRLHAHKRAHRHKYTR